MSTISPPNFSNVTISSGGASSPGITYTAGTGVSWAPQGNYAATGTIHGKDFILDGVSLKEILEERLAMLVPNPELEQEWEELKQIGDAYRKLEAECVEKSKIWKTLKKTA